MSGRSRDVLKRYVPRCFVCQHRVGEREFCYGCRVYIHAACHEKGNLCGEPIKTDEADE